MSMDTTSGLYTITNGLHVRFYSRFVNVNRRGIVTRSDLVRMGLGFCIRHRSSSVHVT